MKTMIELQNVEKIYQSEDVKTVALTGINLKMNKAERMAIIGPSGCGKSTLLHLIGCLDRPTKGTILIDGIDITKLSDDELAKIRRNKIGFVFHK